MSKLTLASDDQSRAGDLGFEMNDDGSSVCLFWRFYHEQAVHRCPIGEKEIRLMKAGLATAGTREERLKLARKLPLRDRPEIMCSFADSTEGYVLHIGLYLNDVWWGLDYQQAETARLLRFLERPNARDKTVTARFGL